MRLCPRRRIHDFNCKVWAEYVSANRDWLRGFRDLAVEMAPDFAAATRLRFSLQLAYLDRRDFRFDYLLAAAPTRLQSAGRLAEFANAVDKDWSEEDEAALHSVRPDYQELCAMIAAVKAKAEEPIEGLSEHLDAVSKTDRCLTLLNAFRQEVARIERDVWTS